jgi:hypothetical protein
MDSKSIAPTAANATDHFIHPGRHRRTAFMRFSIYCGKHASTSGMSGCRRRIDPTTAERWRRPSPRWTRRVSRRGRCRG